MKHRILHELKRARGRFVSGEQLSDDLGVSRTAVWKHIAALRKDGYSIVGQPRSGYALIAAPDKLLPEVVRAGLTTRIMGSRIHYLLRTPSTNDAARAMAREGAPEGTVVIAEEQTAGKGRMGRRWECPPGAGLLFSVVLRPTLPPAEVGRLTLVAALATRRAIEGVSGASTMIKWPNDILIEDRKVCGILTEMVGEVDRVEFVVIGIGVNVNMGSAPLPPEIVAASTSLDVEAGKRLDRAVVLRAILRELEAWYITYLKDGPEPILAEWRSNSATIGRRVTVSGPAGSFEGVATAIDQDGALLVDDDQGVSHRVLAGDVTLRAN